MYQSITNDEFYQKQKKQKINLVDVRERYEFAGGAIPSAQNMPLSELGQCFSELDKRQSYYVICQSGGRSAQACEFLSQEGYCVTNVMGGMSAWKGDKK